MELDSALRKEYLKQTPGFKTMLYALNMGMRLCQYEHTLKSLLYFEI